MKKSTILLITTLAVAAFFAHSPEAMRLVKNHWRDLVGRSRTSEHKPEVASAGVRADDTIKAESHAQDANSLEPVAEIASAHQEQPDTDASDEVLLTDLEFENDKLAQAAAAVSDNDLRRALDSGLEERGPFASQLRDLQVRRWAEADPKAAASWASGLQDSSIAAATTKQIAIAWANKDLTAAVEWVSGLPDGTARQAAVLGLGYEAARNNSFEAFDLVAALPPSSERDSLLVHITRQWAAADSTEAATWANRVPDVALRERLLSAVAIASATKDPAAAASLIATNLNPGRAQDQAAVAIVQRWAQTDSETAASWISLFPDSAAKVAASLALSSVQAKIEDGRWQREMTNDE